MDKWEAQYAFWSGFGIPAYEENSVPTGAVLPYLTYQAADAPFNEDMPVTASIWTESFSWASADTLANTILTALKDGGIVQNYTGGMIWVTIDSVQSMGGISALSTGETGNDKIKRKVLNVTMHFA